MASDSEESDYEDARGHHDNEEDGHVPNYNPPQQEQVGEAVEIQQVNHGADDEIINGVNNIVPVIRNNVNDDEPRGINAGMIVQHVIDNLWPMIRDADDDDDIEDGLDNVHNGYFEEENGNVVDSDDDDTVSFHSETDEPDVYHRSELSPSLIMCF